MRLLVGAWFSLFIYSVLYFARASDEVKIKQHSQHMAD